MTVRPDSVAEQSCCAWYPIAVIPTVEVIDFAPIPKLERSGGGSLKSFYCCKSAIKSIESRQTAKTSEDSLHSRATVPYVLADVASSDHRLVWHKCVVM